MKNKSKSKLAEKLQIRKKMKALEVPKNSQEAKGKVPQTAMLMVRDMAIGGYLGGRAGAGLGRWSLLAGALSTGIAYYAGIPGLAGFGIGMAAAGMNQPEQPKTTNPDGSGKPDKVAEAVERMNAFHEGFKRKLWLDKIGSKTEEKPKKKEVEDTPEEVGNLGNSDDPLAEIEQQLVAEAINYQRESGVQEPDEISGGYHMPYMGEEDEEDDYGEDLENHSNDDSDSDSDTETEQTYFEELEEEIDFDSI